MTTQKGNTNNVGKIKSLIQSHKPRPIFNEQSNLALFFSAKGGCTFLVKWFFFQINELERAKKHHNWIHRFRTEVYYHSDIQAKSKKHFLFNNKKDSYCTIKVIRNPYERAVSSFMHFLFMMKHATKVLEEDFGRSFNLDDKYTFKEFLGFVEAIGCKECNIHWRQQYSLHEELVNIEYIDLNETLVRLPSIEAKYNLQSSKDMLKELTKSVHHSSSKNIEYKFVGEEKYDESIKKNRPTYQSFYNKELLDKVFNLYNDDFKHYGYSSDFN